MDRINQAQAMIHINNFIDKIKFFESRNTKDFIIPLSEAKNLHGDITKLLLVLQESNDHLPNISNNNDDEITGGNW
jgi:hypothetical protein